MQALMKATHKLDDVNLIKQLVTIKKTELNLMVIFVTIKQLNFSANSSIGAQTPSPEKERVVTDLDRVEAGLRRARAAIKAAKDEKRMYDRDYTPMGPMYHDANVFHRYNSFSY